MFLAQIGANIGKTNENIIFAAAILFLLIEKLVLTSGFVNIGFLDQETLGNENNTQNNCCYFARADSINRRLLGVGFLHYKPV